MRRIELFALALLTALLAGCGPVLISYGVYELTRDDPAPDTVLPEVAFLSVPPFYSNDTTPMIEATANKEGVTLYLSVDCGQPFPFDGIHTIAPALADGSHDLELTGVDRQGREAPPASHQWTVDTQPPEPPTITGVESVDPRTLALDWSDAVDSGDSGVGGFRVYYSTDEISTLAANEISTADYDGAIRTATLTDLLPCTEYHLAIACIDRAGNLGPPSDGGLNRVRCGGDGTFSSTRSFQAGTRPTELQAGDFNNDNISDLVVVNYATNDVSVLLGNGENGRGDGTFAAPLASPALWRVGSLDVADFNADGILDLVVTDVFVDWETSGNWIRVLLGNGDGTFDDILPVHEILGETWSKPIERVLAQDLNADGYVDILGLREDGYVTTILNSGFRGAADTDLGGRGVTTWRASVFPKTVITTHLNGYWAAEIVGCDDAAVRVAVGQVNPANDPGYEPYLPDGTFAAGQAFPAGGEAQSVASADLDGDRQRDLIIATVEGTLNVLQNDAAVNSVLMLAPQTITVGTEPGHVETGDFDGDGAVDVVVAGSRADSLSLLLNEGAGSAISLAPPRHFACGPAPSSIVVADFNADRIPDVAVTNTDAGTVTVLLTNGGNRPGSGSFSMGPFVELTHGGGPLATGDLNQDGVADLMVTGSHTYNDHPMVYTNLISKTTNGRAIGEFEKPFPRYLENSVATSLLIEDLDGNGHDEIVFGTYAIDSSDDRGFVSPGILVHAPATSQYRLTPSQIVRFDLPDGEKQPGVPVTGRSESFGPIVPGDFNHDGLLDLAVPVSERWPWLERTRVFLQRNRGTLLPWPWLEHFSKTLDQLYADAGLTFTGLSCETDDFTPIYANLAGGCQYPDFDLAGAADFDGDGGLDLAGISEVPRGGTLTILRNIGRACTAGAMPDRPGFGYFEDPVEFELDLSSAPHYRFNLYAGAFFEDVNGDHVPDVVLLGYGQETGVTYNRPAVIVFPGRRSAVAQPGLTGFSVDPPVLRALPPEPTNPEAWVFGTKWVLADLNDDGALDAIVGGREDGRIAVLLGNRVDGKPDGSFGEAEFFDAMVPGYDRLYSIGGIVAGEFSGDGVTDVAFSCELGWQDYDPDREPGNGVRILFGEAEED